MEAFTLSLTLFFSSLMMAIWLSLRSDPDLFFTRGIHSTIRKNLG